MPRYVAIRPRLAPEWADDFALHGFTVFETERHPEPTGILNADGVELFRVPDTHPMGFDTTRRAQTMKKKPKKGKGKGC